MLYPRNDHAVFEKLTACVCCGSSNIHPALDLGSQPLANNIRQHTEAYPLAVNLCHECWHLQLSVAVDPEEMFAEYLYVSGTTKTLRSHFAWFAEWALALQPHARTVLDIACNDGTQLDEFKRLGLETYGIDPAKNLHELSSANHHVVCDFITPESAKLLGTEQFDIIVAQNVIAHTADPLGLLCTARQLLSDNGVLLIQTSQANMIANGEFDTIYHEHISFFCLNSMIKLARRAGLHVTNAIKSPIHGTSWIFVLRKNDTAETTVAELLAQEATAGLHAAVTYQRWAQRCAEIQHETVQVLEELQQAGYMLVGYGAAAKGMTFLNSINQTLDAVIDDNPLKVGWQCPGNLSSIVDRAWLSGIGNVYKIAFIPLAWNFFDEIRDKIRETRDSKLDVFVRYFPSVEISKG